MKGKTLGIIIILLILPSIVSINIVSAIDGVDWRVDEGDVFMCRLTVGQIHDGEFSFDWDAWRWLKIDTIPVGGYLGNVTTWDELPDIEVKSMTHPDTEEGGFELIYTHAGLSYTGVDWFKPVLPSPGDEGEWNSIMGPFVSTWTSGPWGVPITVEIIPDDMAPSSYDNVFWEIGYAFIHEGISYNVTMAYYASSTLPNNWHSGLIANGTIVGRNATTNEMTNYLELICDPTGPVLYNDSPATYTEGDTGNELVWQVQELFPFEYRMLRNGTVVDTGSMIAGVDTQTTSYTSYSGGGLFHYSVDGLSPAVYNFTLFVSDIVSNSTSGTRILVVLTKPLSPNTLIVIGGGVGLIVILGVIIVMKRRTS